MDHGDSLNPHFVRSRLTCIIGRTLEKRIKRISVMQWTKTLKIITRLVDPYFKISFVLWFNHGFFRRKCSLDMKIYKLQKVSALSAQADMGQYLSKMHQRPFHRAWFNAIVAREKQRMTDALYMQRMSITSYKHEMNTICGIVSRTDLLSIKTWPFHSCTESY